MAKERLGLWGRLIRLPGQLLLAFINATALLVIAACVLSLLVLSRVEETGTRVAGAVTGATLARLQMTPAEVKASLDGLDGRLREISVLLENSSPDADESLKRQLTRLNANLAGLRQAADGIRTAGPDITAAAFDQAGELLTETLYTLRGCGVPTNVVIQEEAETTAQSAGLPRS